MHCRWSRLFAVASIVVTLGSGVLQGQKQDDTKLLQVREAVWHAFFANDVAVLNELVPPETISLGPGADGWENHADILRDAADFQAKGGKLIRLEFPRTEVQHFGDVAVTYSEFVYEIEVNGKRSQAKGRAMEVFVRHGGKWTNPGWHTDRE
ncbi:nuclear transport factor 2 family protein [Acidobacteria bacterium AB60]|nr:nuclear transport factor 2 family protein [Acidobacteria bacterium AB60]